MKSDAALLADWLNISAFVKDMIFQLLVKGDAVGFKRYTKDAKDLDRGHMRQSGFREGQVRPGDRWWRPDNIRTTIPVSAKVWNLELPVDQVLHLKWDAPSFSPRGNSQVLPAFQSIELLRDYRRAEQAIAKRWATPFRLLKVGGAFGQKMVMLEQVRDMVNKMNLKSGLVPFYVTVETHGTEGQILNVEDKVKEQTCNRSR